MVTKLFSVAEHLQDLLKLHWARLYLLILKQFEANANGSEKVKDQSITEELRSLRYRIESKGPETYFQVVSGKSSLLHYWIMCFYVFNSEADYDYLLELFSNESYLSALLICAPHLLRYLTFIVILSKNFKKSSKYNLNHIVSTYENNLCTYKDSTIDFINYLYVDFNFEKANEQVENFKNELKFDVFLSGNSAMIIENSHELLFETFCNIYCDVNIEMIARYLKCTNDEAEIFIVNLIRKNNMKARFSTENKNVLELKNRHNNAYEENVKKSKDLLTKTNLLINNVSKLITAPVK